MELWLSWPGVWGPEAIYWAAAAHGEAGPGPGLGAGAGQGASGVRPAHALEEGWRDRMMNQGGGCRTQHPAHEPLTLLGKEDWGGKTVLA